MKPMLTRKPLVPLQLLHSSLKPLGEPSLGKVQHASGQPPMGGAGANGGAGAMHGGAPNVGSPRGGPCGGIPIAAAGVTDPIGPMGGMGLIGGMGGIGPTGCIGRAAEGDIAIGIGSWAKACVASPKLANAAKNHR